MSRHANSRSGSRQNHQSTRRQSNLRADAARVILKVIDQGQSMALALPDAQGHYSDGRDKGLLAEICYGVMRKLPQLDTQLRARMQKPLSGKKRIVHCLLLAALYQLKHTRVAPHAVVTESVNACRALGAPGMTGLVNGILRGAVRELEQLNNEEFDSPPVAYCHPGWLVTRLQSAYPEQWQDILNANNQPPPLWLRNNGRHQSRKAYLGRLAQQQISAFEGDASNALRLEKPQDVRVLPGFESGDLSVQDLSAQYAAELLAPLAGERILDACAAPGGKTCHLLEYQSELNVTAIDLEPKRLERIKQNLTRLKLKATLLSGDATQPDSWWNGELFDRILVDAPCSATGVIRRNPDSKWLRRDQDIDALAKVQSQILDACWSMLKPGGTLVYATCSVLPDENRDQIQAFIQRTPSAILDPIVRKGQNNTPDWQLLPTDDGGDGFYYARLIKS